MEVESRPLHPLFGAELSGALVKQCNKKLARGIEEVIARAGMLLFRDVDIDDRGLTGFASNFGPLQNFGPLRSSLGDLQIDQMNVARVSNLDEDGAMLPADDEMRGQLDVNEFWHIDSTYVSPGAMYSFLYAVELPDAGSQTEFCDTRVAWEALDSARRAELAVLTADHAFFHSRRLGGHQMESSVEARVPPVRRKLVRQHEPSGRIALIIASHVQNVEGFSYEEGRALIGELTAIATAPERVFRHEWRLGDLLIWDNRCIMHRSMPYPKFEQRRDLRSCRVLDIADPGLATAIAA